MLNEESPLMSAEQAETVFGDAPQGWTHPKLNPKHIIMMDHGGKKTAVVTAAGVLECAHAMGLSGITVEVIELGEQRCVVLATAQFPHGAFQDIGDATPENVGPRIRPHFVRMAATRARTRALKLGCGITLVSVEELEGERGHTEPSRGASSGTSETSDTHDYRFLIEALLIQAGKTEEEIDQYAAGLKRKYGEKLTERLPGIYKAMKEKMDAGA